MIRIYQNLAIVVTSATAVVVLGNTSPAEAFQFFDNRSEWEAALSVPSTTLDFGEPTTILSGTTELPNGVVLSGNVNNGQGIATGTGLSFFITGGGSVSLYPPLDIILPNPSTTLGFDSEIGPSNKILRGNFISIEAEEVNPKFLTTPAFYGVIAEANDPLLTGLSISNLGPGSGSIQVRNISAVPEASSTVGLLAIGVLGTGLKLFRKPRRAH